MKKISLILGIILITEIGALNANIVPKAKEGSQKVDTSPSSETFRQGRANEIIDEYFKKREEIQRKLDRDTNFFIEAGTSNRSLDQMVVYTKRIATANGWSDQKLNEELEIIELKRKTVNLTNSIGAQMALRHADERRLDAINEALAALDKLKDSVKGEANKQEKAIAASLAGEKEAVTASLRALRQKESELKNEKAAVKEELARRENKEQQK